jgi:hypothetical protein
MVVGWSDFAMGSHLKNTENGNLRLLPQGGTSTQRNKISIFKGLTLPFCAARLIVQQNAACEIARNAILNAVRHEFGRRPIDMPQRP